MAEIFRYWEANIAGAPLFPQGVRMLVGAFGTLFGARPPPLQPRPTAPHRRRCLPRVSARVVSQLCTALIRLDVFHASLAAVG